MPSHALLCSEYLHIFIAVVEKILDLLIPSFSLSLFFKQITGLDWNNHGLHRHLFTCIYRRQRKEVLTKGCSEIEILPAQLLSM